MFVKILRFPQNLIPGLYAYSTMNRLLYLLKFALSDVFDVPYWFKNSLLPFWEFTSREVKETTLRERRFNYAR